MSPAADVFAYTYQIGLGQPASQTRGSLKREPKEPDTILATDGLADRRISMIHDMMYENKADKCIDPNLYRHLMR